MTIHSGMTFSKTSYSQVHWSLKHSGNNRNKRKNNLKYGYVPETSVTLYLLPVLSSGKDNREHSCIWQVRQPGRGNELDDLYDVANLRLEMWKTLKILKYIMPLYFGDKYQLVNGSKQWMLEVYSISI